ncbi:hypothetical protein VTI74DRAFT_5662 [Chaetomium olivicolor]
MQMHGKPAGQERPGQQDEMRSIHCAKKEGKKICQPAQPRSTATRSSRRPTGCLEAGRLHQPAKSAVVGALPRFWLCCLCLGHASVPDRAGTGTPVQSARSFLVRCHQARAAARCRRDGGGALLGRAFGTRHCGLSHLSSRSVGKNSGQQGELLTSAGQHAQLGAFNGWSLHLHYVRSSHHPELPARCVFPVEESQRQDMAWHGMAWHTSRAAGQHNRRRTHARQGRYDSQQIWACVRQSVSVCECATGLPLASVPYYRSNGQDTIAEYNLPAESVHPDNQIVRIWISPSSRSHHLTPAKARLENMGSPFLRPTRAGAGRSWKQPLSSRTGLDEPRGAG